MQLVRPSADDFVFLDVVFDLVLVDFISAGSVSVHVEDHRGASNS